MWVCELLPSTVCNWTVKFSISGQMVVFKEPQIWRFVFLNPIYLPSNVALCLLFMGILWKNALEESFRSLIVNFQNAVANDIRWLHKWHVLVLAFKCSVAVFRPARIEWKKNLDYYRKETRVIARSALFPRIYFK